VYWGKGDLDQALNYHSRALAINEESGDKSGITVNLSNIGVCYIDMGKYAQALAYFNRTLAINEELDNNQSIGVSFSKIGIYYYFEGKYEKSIEYLEKSIHIHQEIGYKFFELHTATYLYLAHKQLGKDYNEQEIHRIIKEEKNIIIFEINFRLYELLEDESYLETAYKQIQEKADDMEDELKEIFLNCPIPKVIVEQYNSLIN
jgi:tetratricopeptide (TPR) repeat protein